MPISLIDRCAAKARSGFFARVHKPARKQAPKQGIPFIFKRFAKNTSGVAAIELGLISSMLLTLFMGSVEASRMILMKARLEGLAYVAGQTLVALKNPPPNYANLIWHDIAPEILNPLPTSALRGTVSQVRNSGGSLLSDWSFNAPTGGVSTAATTNLVGLQDGRTAVVVDVSYDYQPFVFSTFFGAVTLNSRLVHFQYNPI
jgi:Flp pilus assembly protein TadG